MRRRGLCCGECDECNPQESGFERRMRNEEWIERATFHLRSRLTRGNDLAVKNSTKLARNYAKQILKESKKKHKRKKVAHFKEFVVRIKEKIMNKTGEIA